MNADDKVRNPLPPEIRELHRRARMKHVVDERTQEMRLYEYVHSSHLRTNNLYNAWLYRIEATKEIQRANDGVIKLKTLEQMGEGENLAMEHPND